MAIGAGLPLSAADLLAALPVVGSKSTFSFTSPAGTGWYRVAGAEVEVYGVSSATLAAGTSFTTGAVIGAAYRPATPANISAGGGVSWDRETTAVVNTDGTITVRNNYSSAVNIQFHGTYFLP